MSQRWWTSCSISTNFVFLNSCGSLSSYSCDSSIWYALGSPNLARAASAAFCDSLNLSTKPCPYFCSHMSRDIRSLSILSVYTTPCWTGSKPYIFPRGFGILLAVGVVLQRVAIIAMPFMVARTRFYHGTSWIFTP